ncbi:hypothetical protein N7486_004194 [Penicillium sp. IBT 16267x]|nr:hypothetical protein N7486_004194 [Penicillium sp. IBT 16267x]
MSLEPQRMEAEALRSSIGDLHAQSQLHINLARLFVIPLTSDLKEEGLGSLFSKRKPHVLEADQAGCTLHWADVALSRAYESKRKSDGIHHVRVDKGRALLEVSKEDHDFIATGLPRQLIDPHSYPCGVALEIDIAELTQSQTATIDKIVEK